MKDFNIEITKNGYVIWKNGYVMGLFNIEKWGCGDENRIKTASIADFKYVNMLNNYWLRKTTFEISFFNGFITDLYTFDYEKSENKYWFIGV